MFVGFYLSNNASVLYDFNIFSNIYLNINVALNLGFIGLFPFKIIAAWSCITQNNCTDALTVIAQTLMKLNKANTDPL